LTDWNLLRPPKLVGFDNYARLWTDAKFWNAMRITLLYVLYNIPIQTVVGLLLAGLLDRLGRSVVLRSIFLATYLIAYVIAAILLFCMLDPLRGIINVRLQSMGV